MTQAFSARMNITNMLITSAHIARPLQTDLSRRDRPVVQRSCHFMIPKHSGTLLRSTGMRVSD